ncbi:MAG: queuosine precursor transporter [Firmicutes bacterium]|nr:queuosine precursor transporter [Bacillota bacterium]
MPNEILLIINLIIIYGGIMVFYKLFGYKGLFAFYASAMILANIEVMILIDAFRMEQTLGNVLFASTFLITDIISENEGKHKSNELVNIGIGVSLVFIIISQLWLLYTPSQNDWAFPYFEALFTNTPRIVIAGFLVGALVQKIDVFLYHKWWGYTEKKFGSKDKMLWLRNNGSTLISQFINAVLFNIAAFAGTYSFSTLATIIISTYIIYMIVTLLDTPFVYLARKIHRS